MKENIILQINFVHDGHWIVVGGDSGSAYVYKRQTGVLVQELHHEEGGRVQTITVIFNSHCISHLTCFSELRLVEYELHCYCLYQHWPIQYYKHLDCEHQGESSLLTYIPPF